MSADSSVVASAPGLYGPHSQRNHGISKSLLKTPDSISMLEEDLEVKTLMPALLKIGVITAEELSSLKAFKLRRRMTGELMEVLFNRPDDKWVDRFVLGLQMSEQTHIIKRLTTRTALTFRPIRELRKTTVEQRVIMDTETIEESIQSNFDSDKLKKAQDALNCDIITIYKGSICFLLDPKSHQGLHDLFDISETEPKVKEFLLSILGDSSSKKYFLNAKVSIEITKKQSGFIFRLDDISSQNCLLETMAAECSDCYRQTVISQYETIVDEIESVMISTTFIGNEGRVPKCINQVCLLEKAQRSRQERADIFLRFILTDELLLLRFKVTFESLSEIRLKNVPCRVHSGKEVEEIIDNPKKLTLCFNVCYQENDGILHIISDRKETSRREKIRSNAVERPLYKDGILHIISDREETSRREKIRSNAVERPLYKVPGARHSCDQIVSTEDVATLFGLESNKKRYAWSGIESTSNVQEIITASHKNFSDEEFAMLDDLESKKEDCTLSRLRDSEIRLLTVGSDSAVCHLLVNTILNDKGFHIHQVSEPRVRFYYDESVGKKIIVSCVPAPIFNGITEDTQRCIEKCVAGTSPGPHAVMVAVLVSQSGQQIEEILSNLENILGKGVRKHIILTFIGNGSKQPIEVGHCPITRDLFNKGQYVHIDEGDRLRLVKNIMTQISYKYRHGENSFFTNLMYQSTEKIIAGKSELLYNKHLECYRQLERDIARLKAEIAPRAIMQKKLRESDIRELVISDMIEEGNSE